MLGSQNKSTPTMLIATLAEVLVVAKSGCRCMCCQTGWNLARLDHCCAQAESQWDAACVYGQTGMQEDRNCQVVLKAGDSLQSWVQGCNNPLQLRTPIPAAHNRSQTHQHQPQGCITNGMAWLLPLAGGHHPWGRQQRCTRGAHPDHAHMMHQPAHVHGPDQTCHCVRYSTRT